MHGKYEYPFERLNLLAGTPIPRHPDKSLSRSIRVADLGLLPCDTHVFSRCFDYSLCCFSHASEKEFGGCYDESSTLLNIQMNESFEISAPQKPTTGDFLSFTILDGERERPARISVAALALLGTSNDTREVFLANFERIRGAAYFMARKNPTLDLIILGSENFK